MSFALNGPTNHRDNKMKIDNISILLELAPSPDTDLYSERMADTASKVLPKCQSRFYCAFGIVDDEPSNCFEMGQMRACVRDSSVKCAWPQCPLNAHTVCGDLNLLLTPATAEN